MGRNKKYSKEIVKRAVELSKVEGCKKASGMLGLPYKTVYNWYKKTPEKDSKNGDGKDDLKYKDFQSYNKEAAEKVKIRMIKLLKKELSFDINGYAGKDKEKLKEKRDFIRFIYDIKEECQEGSIFQVLAKPHLENIYNEYSKRCTNYKIYKIIYNRTLNKLQDEGYAMTSYEIYHKADYEFELILSSYRGCVMYNLNSFNYVTRLNKTLDYIRENFTDVFFEGPYELKENLIKSFFNLLVCHQIISKESDKINMNNSLYYLEKPTDNYITFLSKNVKIFWSKSIALEKMEKYLNGIPTDEGEFLWNYITYEKYDETDKEYYEFALKKFDESHRIYYECAKEDNYIDDGWYNPYYEEPHMRSKAIYDKINVFENVSIIELIAIMQELIYMKKNNLKFKNTFYNNKNIPENMVNKLKAGDHTESAAKNYFKRCVQNRIAHNFGKCEEMKIWREIENELYKLKKQLFSIYDIKTFDSTMHSILLLFRLLDLDETGYSC